MRIRPKPDPKITEPVIKMIDLNELRPYKYNAQTHSTKQVRKIKKLIEIGWTDPIQTNEHLEIISGHGRLLAAKELGLKLVPVIIQTGLTPSQQKVLRLGANEVGKHGGTDMEVLKGELESIIDAGDIDITDTAFDMAVIDSIINGDVADEPEEPVPATSTMPVSQRGDIWVMTEKKWKKGDLLHRLGCGDSLDLAFVRRVVGRRAIDCMFTDSPYGVAVSSIGGRGKIKHAEFAMGSGEQTRDEFKVFIHKYASVAIGLSRPGAVHFHCMSHHNLDVLFEACAPIYDKRLSLCVWVKQSGMGSLYRNAHELVAVYRVPGAPHTNNVQLGKNGRNRSTVWKYDGVNTFRGSRREDLALHPTVKSTGMTADAIVDVTNPGDYVLDLFTGSGTTILACTRTGRNLRGVEIEPAYVDLAIARWVALTGGEVRLDATDQTFAEVRAERHREAA